jgi:hypothetical protein
MSKWNSEDSKRASDVVKDFKAGQNIHTLADINVIEDFYSDLS